jgi:hypothetical protein
MLVSFIVVSPLRGSDVLVKTTIPISRDVHVSVTVVTGLSFPRDPTGYVVVILVPSASTPSMVCVPSCSFDISGRGCCALTLPVDAKRALELAGAVTITGAGAATR